MTAPVTPEEVDAFLAGDASAPSVRGVWWRFRGPFGLQLDFATYDKPPAGTGDLAWQWADETMATTTPADLQLVPSTRPPEPVVEFDGVTVQPARFDPEANAWVTDPALPEIVTDSDEGLPDSRPETPPETTDSAKDQVDS